MDRGIYIDEAGSVGFAGNRKSTDPAGLTWIVAPESEWPEDLAPGRYEWDGSNIKRTAQSIQKQTRQDINSRREDGIKTGMPYTFPDGLAGTVQLRSVADQLNVLAVGATAIALKMQGDTTTVIPFRDQEDRTHELNPDEALAMALSVQAFISQKYSDSWAEKDSL